jgi:hypothetical protein
MYETKDQKEPVYDAKGIETVRRDGCPAVVKVLEKSLRILFETKDISKVKAFVQRQFQKIMQNKASIADLTFAKEFRGLGGYRPGAVVPALELTRWEIHYVLDQFKILVNVLKILDDSFAQIGVPCHALVNAFPTSLFMANPADP